MMALGLTAVAQMDDFDDDDFDFESFEEEFAARDQAQAIADPLEPLNRGIFYVNDKAYLWVLEPVGSGYAWAVPKPGRQAVERFFTNLGFPRRFVNNLLQLKWRPAGIELGRFCVNSTAGVLGLFDPAEPWLGWQARNEDFGQTLGHYGLGGGIALQLPLLGASNLRDTVGMVPDMFLDPLSYLDPWELRLGLRVGDRVNLTSLHLGLYEELKRDAVDPYSFFRNAREQRRNRQIKE